MMLNRTTSTRELQTPKTLTLTEPPGTITCQRTRRKTNRDARRVLPDFIHLIDSNKGTKVYQAISGKSNDMTVRLWPGYKVTISRGGLAPSSPAGAVWKTVKGVVPGADTGDLRQNSISTHIQKDSVKTFSPPLSSAQPVSNSYINAEKEPLGTVDVVAAEGNTESQKVPGRSLSLRPKPISLPPFSVDGEKGVSGCRSPSALGKLVSKAPGSRGQPDVPNVELHQLACESGPVVGNPSQGVTHVVESGRPGLKGWLRPKKPDGTSYGRLSRVRGDTNEHLLELMSPAQAPGTGESCSRIGSGPPSSFSKDCGGELILNSYPLPSFSKIFSQIHNRDGSPDAPNVELHQLACESGPVVGNPSQGVTHVEDSGEPVAKKWGVSRYLKTQAANPYESFNPSTVGPTTESNFERLTSAWPVVNKIARGSVTHHKTVKLTSSQQGFGASGSLNLDLCLASLLAGDAYRQSVSAHCPAGTLCKFTESVSFVNSPLTRPLSPPDTTFPLGVGVEIALERYLPGLSQLSLPDLSVALPDLATILELSPH